SRGSFLVLNSGTRHNLGGFKAYFPPKVSRQAYDVGKMMSGDLQLEMLPRFDDWPKAFEISRPTHEDIGLFFSPHKLDCDRWGKLFMGSLCEAKGKEESSTLAFNHYITMWFSCASKSIHPGKKVASMNSV
ncbi:hypothetical protein EJB05_13207, partial [Eragrostis curvula]